MSAKQRVFGIELDQHGTPQLSKAAAASDQAAHKRLLKKIRKAFIKLGNEHPKTSCGDRVWLFREDCAR